MGRRKLDKTEEQIKEQKDRWWSSYNRRRKERYKNDAEYRDRCKKASRATARRISGKAPEAARGSHCREGYKKARDVSVQHRRIINGRPSSAKVNAITSVEMAALLGLHIVRFRKWHREQTFPRPGTLVLVGKTHASVYTLQQTKSLLKVMERHYADKSYLCRTDFDTIAKLFAVMGDASVRKQGADEGATPTEAGDDRDPAAEPKAIKPPMTPRPRTRRNGGGLLRIHKNKRR